MEPFLKRNVNSLGRRRRTNYTLNPKAKEGGNSHAGAELRCYPELGLEERLVKMKEPFWIQSSGSPGLVYPVSGALLLLPSFPVLTLFDGGNYGTPSLPNEEIGLCHSHFLFVLRPSLIR